MSTTIAPSSRRNSSTSILKVVSGNFLEQYDFFLFGLFASYISPTFFPSDDPTAGLLKTFAVFATGFLMRPLGAVILGAYIDRKGRKKGLVLTLSLMAVGTAVMAVLPGYEQIGILAPLFIILARLVQGFSAGVELGGVSVYLSEIATPGRKGFYVSWQSASQQISMLLASLIAFTVLKTVTPEQMSDWGWRIPFWVGCIIIPVIFILRKNMEETEVFEQKTERPTFKESLHTLWNYKWIVLGGMLLIAFTTSSFYFITTYTPSYTIEVLKLSKQESLVISMMSALSNFIWLPIGGILADRLGRKPLMIFATCVVLVAAYPAVTWLVAEPGFGRLAAVLLLLSFCFGIYNGATVVALTEVMPAKVKASGFSLAYSLATAIFGGMTPLVSTWLIELTGNRAAPCYWLMFAAVCALCSTLWIYSRRGQSYISA